MLNGWKWEISNRGTRGWKPISVLCHPRVLGSKNGLKLSEEQVTPGKCELIDPKLFSDQNLMVQFASDLWSIEDVWSVPCQHKPAVSPAPDI
jgi:hypothetical protein